MNSEKGFEMPISAVATIVLLIMVVVLIFVAYKGYLTETLNSFVNSVNYPLK